MVVWIFGFGPTLGQHLASNVRICFEIFLPHIHCWPYFDVSDLKKSVIPDSRKSSSKFQKSSFPRFAICEGQCLTFHISAVNRDIPDILKQAIAHRHVYKVTESRWSKAENDPTIKGQTFGIVRHTTLVVRGTMFDFPYCGRQSRYFRYFTVIDSPPTFLQVDWKSMVYVWKCPHHRRSNLRDRSISTLVGKKTLHACLH